MIKKGTNGAIVVQLYFMVYFNIKIYIIMYLILCTFHYMESSTKLI